MKARERRKRRRALQAERVRLTADALADAAAACARLAVRAAMAFGARTCPACGGQIHGVGTRVGPFHACMDRSVASWRENDFAASVASVTDGS